jgi:hypothetical protein
MIDVHFLKDPNVLAALQLIMQIAGPNFAVPYDASAQPTDGMAMNQDTLMQYQLPGGSFLQGYAAPGENSNMGKVIGVVMSSVAPVISSYMMLLPIIGVIRGILEVLCAMMNPWAVIKAIKRLFQKWIPPFIAMFPPFAGIIFVLNIIKILLAVTFFILTVLYPIFELIKENIKVLADAFGADGNEQKQKAGKKKIKALLIELLNQMGLIALLRPVLDLIFLILKMKTKLPCAKKPRKKGSDCETEDYNPIEDDSSCCGEDPCPCFLKTPPSGRAMLGQSIYGDAQQEYAWKIVPISGHAKISSLQTYMQSTKEQLNPQLDEPIDEAKTAGQLGDSSHFSIKITSVRGASISGAIGRLAASDLKKVKSGGGISKTVPILKIDGSHMWVVDPSLKQFVGIVDYTIVPNWDVLVARGIVGIACHPDIDNAKDFFASTYDEGNGSGEENHPDVAELETTHNAVEANLNNSMNNLASVIDSIDTPPFDSQLSDLDKIRDDMAKTLLDYKNYLIGLMNSLLSGIINPNLSDFDVNKNLVKAGIEDKAIIHVVPKDTSGSLLAKSLPQGVNMNVSLFTDFGTITDQSLDPATGVITANLTSRLPGDASITAKVNDQYISEEHDASYVVKEITVKFVSDAVLPARRFVSKQRPETDTHSTIGS